MDGHLVTVHLYVFMNSTDGVGGKGGRVGTKWRVDSGTGLVSLFTFSEMYIPGHVCGRSFEVILSGCHETNFKKVDISLKCSCN